MHAVRLADTGGESEGRVFGLDVVRAFAISSVVLSHGLALLETWAPWLEGVDSALGYVGVEAFFVLSGFLVGSILIDSFVRG